MSISPATTSPLPAATDTNPTDSNPKDGKPIRTRHNPLFDPALRVMNRLRYVQKFLLVGVLLLVPLGAALTGFVSEINADIRFSSKERVGLVFIRPLFRLAQAFELHGVLSAAYLSGELSQLSSLTAAQVRIDSLIIEMDAANNQTESELMLSERWARLKEQWATLQRGVMTLSVDSSYDAHIALTTAANNLINDAGNNSNLILDPDLDSYYLMDALILRLPIASAYASELASVTAYAVSAPATFSDRTRLVILSGLIRSVLDANARGWSYAFTKSPALQPALTPAIDAARTALQNLIGLSTDRLQLLAPPPGAPDNARPGSNPPPPPNTPPAGPRLTMTEVLTQLRLSMTALGDLYETTSTQLDTLLINRVNGLSNQRTIVIVITMIGLLIAVYLLIGFYQSVQVTIGALRQASNNMMAGNLSGEVKLETRDELAEVTTSFNQVARALNTINVDLQNANSKLDQRRHELEVANAVAKEANRLKSEFLSTMSHELRTPLNAIVGFTDLMLTGKPGPINDTQKMFLERTAGNNRRLLGLINDILDLSRIEAGRMEIYNAPYSAKEMLDFVCNQSSSLFTKKNLKFDVEIAAEFPQQVIGDRGRLEQVIVNLLSNAAKFTESGEVELKAWTVSDKEFAVSVRDTGRGIPPHLLDAIFEPFRQVEGSTNRQFGGSGLGLAIVRDLCKMMDGNIVVESEVGTGSTFTVTMPIQAGLTRAA